MVDGTFYDAEEVNHRDISEIPHPFIVETIELFKSEKKELKSKIKFIHLNHTNPLLNDNSNATKKINEQGFSVAHFKEIITL